MQTANHLKSKSEMGEKLIVRELENEIIAQKNRIADATKMSDELEMQLKYAGEREVNLAAVASKNEKRLHSMD